MKHLLFFCLLPLALYGQIANNENHQTIKATELNPTTSDSTPSDDLDAREAEIEKRIEAMNDSAKKIAENAQDNTDKVNFQAQKQAIIDQVKAAEAANIANKEAEITSLEKQLAECDQNFNTEKAQISSDKTQKITELAASSAGQAFQALQEGSAKVENLANLTKEEYNDIISQEIITAQSSKDSLNTCNLFNVTGEHVAVNTNCCLLSTNKGYPFIAGASAELIRNRNAYQSDCQNLSTAKAAEINQRIVSLKEKKNSIVNPALKWAGKALGTAGHLAGPAFGYYQVDKQADNQKRSSENNKEICISTTSEMLNAAKKSLTTIKDESQKTLAEQLRIIALQNMQNEEQKEAQRKLAANQEQVEELAAEINEIDRLKKEQLLSEQEADNQEVDVAESLPGNIDTSIDPLKLTKDPNEMLRNLASDQQGGAGGGSGGGGAGGGGGGGGGASVSDTFKSDQNDNPGYQQAMSSLPQSNFEKQEFESGQFKLGDNSGFQIANATSPSTATNYKKTNIKPKKSESKSSSKIVYKKIQPIGDGGILPMIQRVRQRMLVRSVDFFQKGYIKNESI